MISVREEEAVYKEAERRIQGLIKSMDYQYSLHMIKGV